LLEEKAQKNGQLEPTGRWLPRAIEQFLNPGMKFSLWSAREEYEVETLVFKLTQTS
jgi:hypothetical protein